MRTASAQSRFLLRGSLLVTLMLALWWLALLAPLLGLLEVSTEFSLKLFLGPDASLSVDQNRDWNFRIPMMVEIQKSLAQPAGERIQSLEFTLARSGPTLFTFSLPVYWGCALAAGSLRRKWKRVALGTLFVFLVETLSMLTLVWIMAHTAAQEWRPAESGLSKYLFVFLNYLVMNVIPYTAPFLVFVGLDRELQAELFRSGGADDQSSQAKEIKGKRNRTRSAPSGTTPRHAIR